MTDSQTPQWHAETIIDEVIRRGSCVFYSEIFREKVAFIREARYLRFVPKNVVTYTEQELRELFAEGKPPLSESSLKLIHEAKKEGGEVSGFQKKLM